MKQNKNAKAVATMTTNGRNKGFVQGNADFDLTLSLAQLNTAPRVKLENIDCEAADVTVTFVCGGDAFTLTGLFNKDTEDNAGGVGDEAKTTHNFGALDMVDSKGDPAYWTIELAQETSTATFLGGAAR